MKGKRKKIRERRRIAAAIAEEDRRDDEHLAELLRSDEENSPTELTEWRITRWVKRLMKWSGL